MISQRCPKCLSDRVRLGYRPTPIWSKVLLRYNLLCDSCNWEFVGFAVPGTVSHKPTRKKKTKTSENKTDADANQTSEKEDTQVYKTASASKK